MIWPFHKPECRTDFWQTFQQISITSMSFWTEHKLTFCTRNYTQHLTYSSLMHKFKVNMNKSKGNYWKMTQTQSQFKHWDIYHSESRSAASLSLLLKQTVHNLLLFSIWLEWAFFLMPSWQWISSSVITVIIPSVWWVSILPWYPLIILVKSMLNALKSLLLSK